MDKAMHEWWDRLLISLSLHMSSAPNEQAMNDAITAYAIALAAYSADMASFRPKKH